MWKIGLKDRMSSVKFEKKRVMSDDVRLDENSQKDGCRRQRQRKRQMKWW